MDEFYNPKESCFAVKLRTVGCSTVMTVPKANLEHLGLAPGDIVEVIIRKL